MFKTKRALRERIHELEYELDNERSKTRISAFIEEAGLPPCKSPACRACKYCLRFNYYAGSPTYILGCLKGIDCENFELSEPTNNGAPVRSYETY